MSNVNVGSVYQQIIRDVIETSRVDFEEGGVDEGVLEELARGWQRKLSSLSVAQFPWDPKAEPTPPSVLGNAPAIASNYHMDAPQPQPGFSMPILPPMQSIGDNANGLRIKAEPGLENGLNLPTYNANSGKTAQERAAQNLQGMYGSRAAASINAIQSNLPQQGQQQNNQQQQHQAQQRPGQQQAGQRPPLTQAQYQQMIAEQTARQRAQAQGMGNSQTDGADDSEDESESIGILKQTDDQGRVEMGRIEIDHMMRRKIEAMGRRMEGGGLMLPLRERVPSKGKRQNITTSSQRTSLRAAINAQSSGPSQYDGIDDDDEEEDKKLILKEEDEDAINSDLDDPDEGLNEEEDDDEAMGHIMLCMYDKVQRVKNKWKCVMKDGVLTVNGKEYVFHKANGEFEW